MSELNHGILVENIKLLMKNKGMTQQQLAEALKMTQANVSKALNPNDKRCFTLEQVFAISQHFGVSIDELTGNKVVEKASLSPRAVLAFLVDLLRTDKARVASGVNKEEVFLVGYGADGPSCNHTYLDVEYPVIYFPSYFEFDGTDYDTVEAQELYAEFTQCGNETPFYDMNDIVKKLLPMIELYKKKEIPEEAFQMIVDGYLKQLRGI